MKKVAIIDYKLSNLFSVKHACEFVGMDPIITSNPEEIRNADAVILPGVGAFKDAMNNLESFGIVKEIHSAINSGKPFMGICLGLQLLFSTSLEYGEHKGLDIISGTVQKFPTQLANNKNIKVPAIGWNRIYQLEESPLKWESSPLKTVQNQSFMYFVHSFYIKPESTNVILTMTEYEGIEYCSGVQRENLVAFQFHPEKSGKQGLEIYNNWSKLIK